MTTTSIPYKHHVLASLQSTGTSGTDTGVHAHTHTHTHTPFSVSPVIESPKTTTSKNERAPSPLHTRVYTQGQGQPAQSLDAIPGLVEHTAPALPAIPHPRTGTKMYSHVWMQTQGRVDEGDRVSSPLHGPKIHSPGTNDSTSTRNVLETVPSFFRPQWTATPEDQAAPNAAIEGTSSGNLSPGRIRLADDGIHGRYEQRQVHGRGSHHVQHSENIMESIHEPTRLDHNRDAATMRLCPWGEDGKERGAGQQGTVTPNTAPLRSPSAAGMPTLHVPTPRVQQTQTQSPNEDGYGGIMYKAGRYETGPASDFFGDSNTSNTSAGSGYGRMNTAIFQSQQLQHPSGYGMDHVHQPQTQPPQQQQQGRQPPEPTTTTTDTYSRPLFSHTSTYTTPTRGPRPRSGLTLPQDEGGSGLSLGLKFDFGTIPPPPSSTATTSSPSLYRSVPAAQDEARRVEKSLGVAPYSLSQEQAPSFFKSACGDGDSGAASASSAGAVAGAGKRGGPVSAATASSTASTVSAARVGALRKKIETWKLG